MSPPCLWRTCRGRKATVFRWGRRRSKSARGKVASRRFFGRASLGESLGGGRTEGAGVAGERFAMDQTPTKLNGRRGFGESGAWPIPRNAAAAGSEKRGNRVRRLYHV